VKKGQIAERGARVERRDDREYSKYLREEQRGQPGCPARSRQSLHRREVADHTEPYWVFSARSASLSGERLLDAATREAKERSD
jgi:hypothetical protein